MRDSRKDLKQALEAHLIPVLIAAGFEGPVALAAKVRTFYYFRRDGDLYRFISIQFTKQGRAKFRLNFSESTPASMEARLKIPFSPELLREPSGELRGSLHPISLPYFKLFTWFAVGNDKRPDAAARLVQGVAELYPEIERWWTERKVGPHLWIPYKNPGQHNSPSDSDSED